MSDKLPQTGSIPYRIVDAGLLSALNRAELLAYAIIAGHANRKTLECSPSVERLAKLMRQSTRTAERATKGLTKKGFVRITKGGSRGVTNTYVLEENPDNIAVTVSSQETPSNPPPKPRQIEPETPTDLSPNPDTQGVGQTEEQMNISNNSSVVVESVPVEGGDAVINQEVVKALVLAGIGEPTQSKLAALEGITPEMVTRVAQRTKASGGGGGAIVRAIEAEVQADEVRRCDVEHRRETAALRQAERQQKAEAEQVEHDQFVASQATAHTYINSLDDAALAQAKATVLADLDAPARNFHSKHDPRKDPFLMQRIYQLYRDRVA